MGVVCVCVFFFSSRRRHTRLCQVTGVQTCALPIWLARALQTPLCLDETLRDAGIARQIVALEGPLVWNIKVHRIGGLTEACRIYRVAAACGARLWAGTMPESGIGSQAGIAVAALPGCVYRSEERRVGKECLTQCRSRWS